MWMASTSQDEPKVCVCAGLLMTLIPLTLSFNLDTGHPRIFTPPHQGFEGSLFGHKVCHFKAGRSDRVLVTDPQHNNGTGTVYSCSYHGNQCKPVSVEASPGIAFGLSLSCNSARAMVCGPRMLQKCEGFNYLNGECVELSPTLTETERLRPAFQECHVYLPPDAVILFDDSQSISSRDFSTMITFIKSIIHMFSDPRAQVAVAKFSTGTSAVFNFERFVVERDPDQLLRGVTHSKGDTHTPSAIRFVLEKMFSVEVGMRENSKRLLVVITDGKSNDPNEAFDDVISLAEEMGVTRLAIGVGREYSRVELEQIASSAQYVFESHSFDALNSIQNQLRDKLFSVEGSDVGNSSSIQLELSQGGFSVALSQDVSVFGAVGAFSWAGGLVEKTHGANSTFINTTHTELRDSYLGYSVAVAAVNGSTVYFAGAPRHLHRGLVLGFTRDPLSPGWAITHSLHGNQVVHGNQLGSYFGAEVCVFDNGGAVWLLVGAPLYHAQDVGGVVYICHLQAGGSNCSVRLQGQMGNEFGQFGAALAVIPDLNGDGMPELAVGAPHEGGGQGALYLFLGRSGGIHPRYSQRVSGAALGVGLQHFGVALHSAGGLGKDGLTSLVVGCKGAALVLRSHPVMCLPVSVTLDPSIIPQDYFHCSAPMRLNTPVAMVTVCVTLVEVVMGNIQGPLQAAVSVSLELDSQNQDTRLLFSTRSGSSVLATTLRGPGAACYNLSIIIPECISDYHEVTLSGKLSVEGQEIPNTGGLKPVLSPDCPPTFTHMVVLEKVCGPDHVCVSDLHVSLGFTSDEVVRVAGYVLRVEVEVSNNGEDALSAQLILSHPGILSFTQAKPVTGQVQCASNSTEQGQIHSHTVCQLSASVLRQQTKTTIQISFIVSDPSSLTDRLSVQATVTSKNEHTSTLQDNTATSSVPVKLPVSVAILDGDSTQFIKYPDSTELKHIYKVENMGSIDIPVVVTFVLPWEMDSGFHWNVSLHKTNGSRARCEKRETMSKNNNASAYGQYCEASVCHVIGCGIYQLTRSEPVSFTFCGRISSVNTEVSGVHMKVVSWGFLSFDDRYALYPADGARQLSISAGVEFPAQALTVLIVSLSVFFGLVAMVIIFGVLYKVGFFRSQGMFSPSHEPGPAHPEPPRSGEDLSASAETHSSEPASPTGQASASLDGTGPTPGSNSQTGTIPDLTGSLIVMETDIL